MTSQIIGLGGGGFSMEPQNPLLDLYILNASPVKNPRVCLLPTASADDTGYVQLFKHVFKQYPCTTTHLNVFSPRIADMESFLLGCDIIYVPGGNTKSMLGLWREWGIDKILRKAYDKGIVLAGVSAGFVCWFKECITDSFPGKYGVMPCLDILPMSACPHYDGQAERQDAFHSQLSRQLISPGYAVDDGVGLHFVDGKLHKIISSCKDVHAYYLTRNEDGQTQEVQLEPEFLGTDDNIHSLMTSLFGEEEMEAEIDVSED